jgi:DNA-binding response OmpR family regulator
VDGHKLAQNARVRRPSLKVLLMSGYPEKIVAAVPAFADGMDMIAKPFTFEELASRIGSVMGVPGTS